MSKSCSPGVGLGISCGLNFSGFDEFLNEPDNHLHGDLSEKAYQQRGPIAKDIEIRYQLPPLDIPRTNPCDEYSDH